MDRYDLFDKLFTEKKFIVGHNGKQYKRIDKVGFVEFIDEETNTVILTITNNKVLCSECGVEMTYDDCEMINYKTLNLICPECFYEYQVTFPSVKQVKTSDKIKSIIENSIYLANVGNEQKHVIYKGNKFLSIEDDDLEVNPDMLIEEMFLTNAEIAELREKK